MYQVGSVEYINADETCGLGATVCNVIWFIFTGWLSFIIWMIAGILCCITIIFIPFGIKCFKLALFIAAPFGQGIRQSPIQLECPYLFCNILWLLLLGIEIAFIHLIMAFWCFITIIGIPFAIQHIKFAYVALWPFGVETGFFTEPAAHIEPVYLGQPL